MKTFWLNFNAVFWAAVFAASVAGRAYAGSPVSAAVIVKQCYEDQKKISKEKSLSENEGAGLLDDCYAKGISANCTGADAQDCYKGYLAQSLIPALSNAKKGMSCVDSDIGDLIYDKCKDALQTSSINSTRLMRCYVGAIKSVPPQGQKIDAFLASHAVTNFMASMDQFNFVAAVQRTCGDNCPPQLRPGMLTPALETALNPDKIEFSEDKCAGGGAPLALAPKANGDLVKGDPDPKSKQGQKTSEVALRSDASTGLIKCPAYIPNHFCGGSKYDPTKYKRVNSVAKVDWGDTTEARGAGGGRVGSPGVGQTSNFEFDPTIDATQTTVNATTATEVLYPIMKGYLVEDIADFQIELLAEKYLETAALQGDLSAGRQAKLLNNTCTTGAKDKIPTMLKTLSAQSFAQQAKAADAEVKLTAKAAACMQASVNRRNNLAHDFAFDVKTSSPLVPDQALDQAANLLGGGYVAKIIKSNVDDSRVQDAASGAAKASSWTIKQAVNTVMGHPLLRTTLREALFFEGISESNSRKCGALQSWGTAGRANGCADEYAEYLILSQELDTLSRKYPLLTENTKEEDPKSPLEFTALAQTSSLSAGLKGYSPVVTTGDHAGVQFCMEKVKDQEPTPSDLSSAKTLRDKKLDPNLDGILNAIQAICKNPSGLAISATQNSFIMSEFFNCKRTRFNDWADVVQALPQESKTTPPPLPDRAGVTDEQCAARQDSAWVACHLFGEKAASDEGSELVSKYVMQLPMDVLASVSLPNLGSDGEGIIKRIATGVVVGGTVSAGMTGIQRAVNDPNDSTATANRDDVMATGFDEKKRTKAKLDEAKAHSGTAGAVGDYTNSVLEGGFAGGLFASAEKGHAGSTHLDPHAELQITDALGKIKEFNPEAAERIQKALEHADKNELTVALKEVRDSSGKQMPHELDVLEHANKVGVLKTYGERKTAEARRLNDQAKPTPAKLVQGGAAPDLPTAAPPDVPADRLERESHGQLYRVNSANNPALYAEGTLSEDGTLHLDFRTKLKDDQRSAALRGGDEFKNIVNHFGSRVTRIEGNWSESSLKTDNLELFKKAIAEGKSPDEAVRSTWTGQQAKANGFDQVLVKEVIKDEHGKIIKVVVDFTKPVTAASLKEVHVKDIHVDAVQTNLDSKVKNGTAIIDGQPGQPVFIKRVSGPEAYGKREVADTNLARSAAEKLGLRLFVPKAALSSDGHVTSVVTQGFQGATDLKEALLDHELMSGPKVEIRKEDWLVFRSEVERLHADGIAHGDMFGAVMFKTDAAGHTHFGVIDWDGRPNNGAGSSEGFIEGYVAKWKKEHPGVHVTPEIETQVRAEAQKALVKDYLAQDLKDLDALERKLFPTSERKTYTTPAAKPPIVQTTTRADTLRLEDSFSKSTIDFGSSIDHLNIHHDGEVAGSQFNGAIFKGPKDVEQAILNQLPAQIHYDQFGRAELTMEINTPGSQPLGYTGVFTEEEILKRFPGAKVELKPRSPGGTAGIVNGIHGSWFPEFAADGSIKNPQFKFEPDAKIVTVPKDEIQKISGTQKLTVIIQKDAKTGQPMVKTIFPGDNAPAFPAKIAAYKVDTLDPKSLETKYWQDHVFVQGKDVAPGKPAISPKQATGPPASHVLPLSFSSGDFTGFAKHVADFCKDCPAAFQASENTIKHSNQHYPGKPITNVKDALAFARVDRSTTIFSDGTKVQDALQAVQSSDKIRFDAKAQELLAQGNETIAFDVEVPHPNGKGKTVIRVVTCIQTNCADDTGGVITQNAFKKGDILLAFPICGPEVLIIPRADKVAKAVGKFKPESPLGTGDGKLKAVPCE